MTPDELGLDVQIEVAATPEQVWEAISTGPGISAWFMPAEVEGERITFHHMAGGSSEAEVTDAEAPRRLRFTEGDGAQATEFLVEARSGGTCVVRVVGSGFGGKGADDGWTAALLGLKLYLEHFAGQSSANVLAGGRVPGPQARAWEELQSAVGLGELCEGSRVSASADGAAALTGVVEGTLATRGTLRLEEPAPGLAFVGVGGPDDETVFAAVRAGARGYLLKGATRAEILRTVRAVAAGDAVFGPAIARRLMAYFARPAPAGQDRPFPELTEREREVLDLVARGRSNAEITAQLVLSPKTIRNHVSNIFAKLEVRDRAEAIVRAREAGLGS